MKISLKKFIALREALEKHRDDANALAKAREAGKLDDNREKSVWAKDKIRLKKALKDLNDHLDLSLMKILAGEKEALGQLYVSLKTIEKAFEIGSTCYWPYSELDFAERFIKESPYLGFYDDRGL